jgi:hypothetical protein
MRRPAIRWAVLAAAILVGGCGGPEGSGSSNPEPEVTCVGVPQGPCEDAAASLVRSLEGPAAQVTVTCSIAACTNTDGRLQLEVLLVDGRRDSRAMGYGSNQQVPEPVEPPVLTVVPICLGVPFATCRDMAESAVGSGVPGVARRPIARITVRCKGVCTPTKGEGETRIDFADGTNETSSWGYESTGG